jgi:hypothetical protein
VTKTLRNRIAVLESAITSTAGPSDDEYWAALAREEVRLRLLLDRLACKTSDCECTPPLVPDLLGGDTPEQEARDQAIIEAWGRADYARRGLDYDAEQEREAAAAREQAAEFERVLAALQAGDYERARYGR